MTKLRRYLRFAHSKTVFVDDIERVDTSLSGLILRMIVLRVESKNAAEYYSREVRADKFAESSWHPLLKAREVGCWLRF